MENNSAQNLPESLVMSQSQQDSTNPSQQVPSTPPPSSDGNPTKQTDKHGHVMYYVIVIVGLLIGLASGYLMRGLSLTTVNSKTPADSMSSKEITLPSDAVQIQACANNKGTLFVKPQDIPVGPVYMFYKGKVIGIEYMLGKDEFLQGKSFKFLQALGMKINHVNIGLLSVGHEGYPKPHYHVDLYLTDKNTEQSIVCPTSPTQSPAPSSPETSPSASSSSAVGAPTGSLLPSSPSPTVNESSEYK